MLLRRVESADRLARSSSSEPRRYREICVFSNPVLPPSFAGRSLCSESACSSSADPRHMALQAPPGMRPSLE